MGGAVAGCAAPLGLIGYVPPGPEVRAAGLAEPEGLGIAGTGWAPEPTTELGVATPLTGLGGEAEVLKPSRGSRSLAPAAEAPVNNPAVPAAAGAPAVPVGPGLLPNGKLMGEADPVPPAFLQPAIPIPSGKPKHAIMHHLGRIRAFSR